MRRVTAAVRHAAASVVCGLVAFVFVNPCLHRFSTAILGSEAGDNIDFVWNFWWAQVATVSDRIHLWSPQMFAPLGTSLLLHTLTPAFTLGWWALFPSAPPLLAYNVTAVVCVALNGLLTYAAAHSMTRQWWPSLFAGLTFLCAPFLIIRLEGHLNVIAAWGLPLLALSLLWLHRQPRMTRAFGVGVVLGCLAYIDYYALVFGIVLATVYLPLSWRTIRVEACPMTAARRRLVTAVGALIGLLGVVAISIWLRGGFLVTIGGIRLSMLETFNLRVAIGVLTVVAWLTWKWPKVSLASTSGRLVRVLPLAALVVGGCAMAIAPLMVLAVGLWRHDEYVQQVYYWRSAPSGIDIASLVLGNPQHPLVGEAITRLYDRFHISLVESSAWLGVAPLAMTVLAVTRLRSDEEVRRWLWIGGIFAVWSLGPYLMAFGTNTGVMLPETIIRFIPLVANARMPGRAFVVVQLAVALLGAKTLATLRPMRFGTMLAMIATVAVVADYWPRPRGFVEPKPPHVYWTLRDLSPGTVLEVPLGIRDGSGERGKLDAWALYDQTIHGHPIMGGFVARLSQSVRSSYEADPIAGPLLDMSEGLPAREKDRRCEDSVVCSGRYIVLDKSASPALQRFIKESFALTLIEDGADKALFRIDRVQACSCSH